MFYACQCILVRLLHSMIIASVLVPFSFNLWLEKSWKMVRLFALSVRLLHSMIIALSSGPFSSWLLTLIVDIESETRGPGPGTQAWQYHAKRMYIVQIKALHDYMIMIIVFTTANIWMFPAILGMQKKSSYCLSTAIQNEFWNFHEITDPHCGKIFIYSQFKVISLLFVWSSNLI